MLVILCVRFRSLLMFMLSKFCFSIASVSVLYWCLCCLGSVFPLHPFPFFTGVYVV
jgi:hypothetical protein